MMNIEVQIRRIVDDGSRLKALVSVTLDRQFAIHGIKLLRRDNGSLFAAMPSRQDDNRMFRDIAHPIGSEARRELETAVLQAYEDYLTAHSPDLNGH